MFPIIALITSPDYINQKIVHYIETRLAAEAINKRSYEYAASFEDFLKIICASHSVDELVLIRTSIVNDIMQATAQQNVQTATKAVDGDGDQGGAAGGAVAAAFSKSDLANANKLKRYIQQLSFAKLQCEKNLNRLGWTGNFPNELVGDER